MNIKDWKKQVFTIPNFLSLFRLALIPVYISIYLKARIPSQFYTAGSILAVSCLTDAIDGRIARHCNMISTLGKILDPLADKLTQFAVTLCLSMKYPAMRPVLVLFIIKELYQLTIGAAYLRRRKMLPGALMAGKICTAVLFLSLIIMVLIPNLPAWCIRTLSYMDLFFLAISFLSYILAYFGKHAKVQDLKTE